MNLPIEFTTTVKRRQLTNFYRNTSFKRSLWLMFSIIPMLIIVVLLLLIPFGSGLIAMAANTLYSILLLLIPIALLVITWLILRYFLTSYFVNQQLKENPSTTAVRAYVLNLDTVSHFSELENGEFSWKLVSAATISDKLISITMRNGSAHLIDPADLEAEQLNDVRALLVEKGFL